MLSFAFFLACVLVAYEVNQRWPSRFKPGDLVFIKKGSIFFNYKRHLNVSGFLVDEVRGNQVKVSRLIDGWGTWVSRKELV